MGVAGLWDIIRPAAKTRSLTELSVVEGFEANPGGVRGFRLGIDASIWFFHAEYGKEGENPVLRTLFFRCATLMHSPFLPLFVFDGPKRPDVKRGKKINRTSHKLIPGMKALVEAFGFEWRMAPAEAEAELAYLNRVGVIDGILSDDVDNFLFGATTVIRNPSNNLSGNRANPVLNSAGRDDKNHSKVYRLADITSHPDIHLTRGGMILIGLMSGGDYQQGGLARCGTVTAHGLAKCGFGDSLYEAANNLPREDLPSFLSNWRNEMRHELRTNSQGHIGRKQPALAKSIPDAFPDIDILLSYTNPITSESMGRASNNLKLTWGKEPDLGKLAATCEFYFEWGYKEAIIKRFRTVIWHSAVLRILRRAVLDLDARAKASTNDVLATPKKKTTPRLEYGTPSKMIAKHFSTMHISEDGDDTDETEQPLIVKIHSMRKHVSTDGILEYRLEIAPAQLVRIAESGIKGTRSPEESDEWASEEDDEDDPPNKKGTKNAPPDPLSHMRVWMPACMVQLVEPHLVEEFDAKVNKKAGKATKKGNKRAKDPPMPPKPTSASPSPQRRAIPPATTASSRVDIVPLYEDSSSPAGSPTHKLLLRDLTKKNCSAKSSNDRVAARSLKISNVASTAKAPQISTRTKSATSRKSSSKNIARKVPPTPEEEEESTGNEWDTVLALPGPSGLFKKVTDSRESYISLSEEDANGSPTRQTVPKLPTTVHKPVTLAPEPFPLFDDDLKDGPFSISYSQGATPASPSRSRKKLTTSPPGSDSPLEHLEKSPRKSIKHTSPRSPRTIPKDYPIAPHSRQRSSTPSPSTRLPKDTTRAYSPPRIQSQPVIEISSDSDSPPIAPLKIRPLL
ncbi:hypothetical protein BD779DRAFT_1671184 [Infundibulicybe gibba]|nr:hypothetical protein BD779DRAFT_1671184 [Infundibulicybe gibba]